jgi:ferrous iron transport protein A
MGGDMEKKKILSSIEQGKKVKVVGFDYRVGSFSRQHHRLRHMQEAIDSDRHGTFFTRRLQEMGLLPGKIIEVVRNTNTGPVEINVMGSKLAIGRGIASKILVEEIDE